MKEGGSILAGILKALGDLVVPGITTQDLENEALKMIKNSGGRPAFKGYTPSGSYQPFPTALCTSINDEVVHAPAVPGRILKTGDIVGIDVGMQYPAKNGMYTDTAITVPVGSISKGVKKLLDTTRESLDLAIAQVRPGNFLNDIGKAVQEHAESCGFSVVRDLVGHGVGRKVHEEPQVPNFAITKNTLENIKLEPGMTLAIEPMINMGSYRVKSAEDGFTIKTSDGKLSAHFEHTIVVTLDGCMVLTKK